MVTTLEREPRSGFEQPSLPHVASPHTKRMLEIKVDRWNWLRSMGRYNEARQALSGICDYALKNASGAKRSSRRVITRG